MDRGLGPAHPGVKLRPGERPFLPTITQESGAGSSLAFVPMVGGDLGMGGSQPLVGQ